MNAAPHNDDFSKEFADGVKATVVLEALLRRLMRPGYAPNWISIADRPPPPEKTVWVWFRSPLGGSKQTRAFYVPPRAQDPLVPEPETTGNADSFLSEGWWEDPVLGNHFLRIPCVVEFWAELPPDPLESTQEVAVKSRAGVSDHD
jgi:hypothetical protein